MIVAIWLSRRCSKKIGKSNGKKSKIIIIKTYERMMVDRLIIFSKTLLKSLKTMYLKPH